MNKQELIDEIKSAQELLKDYNRFIDLLRDEEDPKGILARLNRTICRIEMLMEANELKDLAHPENNALKQRTGSLVKIKPCGEKYGNKTYLGFYIGDIALGSYITVTEGKIQLNFGHHNPAIYVPELKEVIYGCASWWSEITSEEDLKDITDNDIENVWYVKMLRNIKNEA